MSDKKISQLTALAAVDVASTDVLPIVDTSATETKKITFANLTTAIGSSGGLALDSAVVHNTGDETVAGTKTFSSTITGSISGNAATATTATNQSGGTVAATSISDSGNLTFTGTGNRITGDFSNSTAANRVFVQTSTPNAVTSFGILPNGTYQVSQFLSNNASDPANASRVRVGIDTSSAYLTSDLTGTGSYLPITFSTNGSEQMRLTSTGLGIGTSSPSYKLDIVSSAATVSKFTYSGISAVIYVGGAGTTYFSDTGVNNAWGVNSGSNYVTAFTNGSERLRLDSSGNLGLGVTPSAWYSNRKAIQFGAGGALSAASSSVEYAFLSTNNYENSGGTSIYLGTGKATKYEQSSGTHIWSTAGSGTAGNAISFTQAMTLDASGNLGLGGTATANGAGYTTLGVNGSTAGIIEWQAGGVRQGQSYATTGAMYIGSTTSIPFAFTTANSERMRIDSSGNVGIGSSAPTSKLQVVGLPVYANNAAAIAGGLTAGAFYRTGADPDPVCVVH